MSDLISRQGAIDAFDKQNWSLLNIPICKEIRNAAKDTIRALPSVQPERKKGRWIPLQLSMPYPPYQCSCCFGNAPMVARRHLEALLTNFCPNCGADMREGDTT